MTSSEAPYLTDWRNSFSLVRKNLYCKNGVTFRGRNSHVEMPFCMTPRCDTGCIQQARDDAGRGAGRPYRGLRRPVQGHPACRTLRSGQCGLPHFAAGA